jgi:Skp family chaperone for outer membrane proteins
VVCEEGREVFIDGSTCFNGLPERQFARIGVPQGFTTRRWTMGNSGRYRVFSLLVILALGALAASAQDSTIKIGIVDLEQVVAQSAMGQGLQARLEGLQSSAQAEADALTEKSRETRRRISEGAGVLSDEKLAELQAQYEADNIAIRRFRDDKQREAQKIQQEGLRDIENALRPVFQRLQENDGFDLILSGAPGIVVMATEEIDITALVIERFNASQAGGN